MPDNVFLDSNILVYAKIDNKDMEKHKQAVETLRTLQGIAFVSTQVLNEFYNVMLKHNVKDEKIQEAIDSVLCSAELHVNTLSTIKFAWKLRNRYGYSYFDSLILAAAIESQCAVIHTEDMQDQQIIEGKLRINNPLGTF